MEPSHMETSYKHSAEDEEYEIVLKGDKKAAITALRILYDEDIIDCDHEFTQLEGVDDDTAPGKTQHSNPDVERCLICGKYYHPKTEEWRDE